MNFKVDISIVNRAAEDMKIMIPVSWYLDGSLSAARYIYQIVILIYLLFLPSFSFAFSLKVLKNSEVCMVNDKYMGKPQIPVVISEDYGYKTYYGCCESCIYKLKTDYFARNSHDPYTNISQSKADAVIAVDGQGKVYYFHSFYTLSLFHNSK